MFINRQKHSSHWEVGFDFQKKRNRKQAADPVLMYYWKYHEIKVIPLQLQVMVNG